MRFTVDDYDSDTSPVINITLTRQVRAILYQARSLGLVADVSESKLFITHYGIMHPDKRLHLAGMTKFFDLEQIAQKCARAFVRAGGDLESLWM
ncbi:hypothetical protein PNOK_0834800 [Pyrrhoderma noxium]|uniref:Uncharacterized protein n=1 Tax=Pyrrhoderma noxium TaxID=2282107 RepID=A0A286UAY2_9AGAM|nr:hypothetical protein PNOK_0834800 [Pyrrhoderma noxium]